MNLLKYLINVLLISEELDSLLVWYEGGPKAFNKLKNSLKTVQHLGKISEREREDFRLYIE